MARRPIPDFTPEQLDQIESIKRRVLDTPYVPRDTPSSPAPAADEPGPLARPIGSQPNGVPIYKNWYAEGGPVKKPIDQYPGFRGERFGIGDLHTRKGRGLVEDDVMPNMTPKPGETMHLREDTSPVDGYARGGSVRKHGSDTMVTCKNKFS